MSVLSDLIWLVPLLPLVAAVLNLLLGWRLGDMWKAGAGWLATGAMAGAFGVSVGAFAEVLTQPAPSATAAIVGSHYVLYEWIGSGDFHVNIGFYIDQLSAAMMLLVTGVGTLIHLYAIGYMDGDEDTVRGTNNVARFFVYLPLFAFAMLMLIMGDNYLLTFFGWEGVGVCSYLLIGFWYNGKGDAPSAGEQSGLAQSSAAKKAFITNRVGDVGFALGIMLLFVNFGSLAFTDIFPKAGTQTFLLGNMTLVCLLLFTGAMGKSAQFPLHVWLPDAMQGPTPVSALIHAATMVTAGVYLVARSNPLFRWSADAMFVVMIIGLTTALLGAALALLPHDIKRIVAYSTMSQLGYMFAGLGVGAYTAAIFHLLMHGVFKALLFLGSGSVIHALHKPHGAHDAHGAGDHGGHGGAPSEGGSPDGTEQAYDPQDIRNMGQLFGKMPITAITFLIGALSNAGFWLTTGFWSKDEIITAGVLSKYPWVGGLLIFGSFLTAFYMFRLVFTVFFGKDNVRHKEGVHPHDPTPLMWVPLVVLAVPALLLGLLIGLPPEHGPISQFLEPVFQLARGEESKGAPTTVLLIISGLAGTAGIFFAWLLYYRETGYDANFQRILAPLNDKARLGFDALYDTLWVRGGRLLTQFSWDFDRNVIDGLVNGVAGFFGRGGTRVGRTQTGFVGNYALAISLGVIALMTYLLFASPVFGNIGTWIKGLLTF